MKIFLVFLSSLCLAAVGFVQAQAPVAQGDAPLPYTSQELDQIVGPVALYPDPLVALILPASTTPGDVVMASRYLSQNGDPAQIPNQPWDDSVKALTHYPDLLKWMDQNLDWTTQLGSAFIAQPADVMDAIQQRRAQAKADGTLVSDAQQQIGVDDDGNITIEPVSADAIYVPQYDPDAVYDDEYDSGDGPLFTYGEGCAVGPWLGYWLDWHHRGIFLGDWRRGWNYRGRTGFADDANARPWRPNPGRVHAQYEIRTPNMARPVVARPQPLPGVSVIRGKHASALTTSGLRTSGLTPPQRDFTGRGVVASPGRAGPAVARPVVEPTQESAQSAINGYGRGSDARAASERGQVSRQSYGAPSRPVAPAAPVYRPPAQSESRPAFQGMSSGAGASSAGERGAASRGH